MRCRRWLAALADCAVPRPIGLALAGLITLGALLTPHAQTCDPVRRLVPWGRNIGAEIRELPSCGGHLVLAPGRWNVTEPIVIDRPVTLEGAGARTVLRASTAIAAVIEIAPGVAGARVARLRLEGAATGASRAVHRGVYVGFGATGTRIEQVVFSGPRRGGGFNLAINLSNASRTRVTGCRIERTVSSNGNGAAVLVEGRKGRANVVANNVIDGSGMRVSSPPASALFVTSGASHVTILANEILDWPQVGIAVNDSTYADMAKLPPVTDLIIAGNRIRRSHHSGIVITGETRRTRVAGNTVETSGLHGIVIEGNSVEPLEVPVDIQVTNNTVIGSGGSGILIAGAVGTQVIGNTLHDNGRLTPSSAIRVTRVGGRATGERTVIEDNRISGSPSQTAIRIDDDVKGTSMRGNAIKAGGQR
jgi:parallel beta-helix repeat protein